MKYEIFKYLRREGIGEGEKEKKRNEKIKDGERKMKTKKEIKQTLK